MTMKNLIKKSTLISSIAEKQRFQFFSKAYKAIDLCIERILWETLFFM